MSKTDSSATADVRTRILEAGAALLHDEGVTALTQPRVARAAGVRQSHITYYFPTRNDLLLAVVQHSILQTVSGLVDGSHAGGSIGQLAARVAEAIRDTRRTRALLGMICLADEDERIRTSLQVFVATVRERIAGVVRGMGVTAGPQEIALLHATVVGLAVLNLARDNDVSQEEAMLLPQTLLGLLAGQGAADAGQDGEHS